MSQVVDVASLLDPGFAVARLPAREEGPDLLLAPPGARCPEPAREQWQGLREVLAKEVSVHLATAPSGGDGAWAPEPLVVGRAPGGARRYLPGGAGGGEGLETRPLAALLEGHGYQAAAGLPAGVAFAGAADALWHPGRQLLWGGYGTGTDLDAYPGVAAAFGAPVLRLELAEPRLPSLDRCLLPLDADTALYYPDAFTATGQSLLAAVFPSLVPVTEKDACEVLALGGLVLPGRKLVLPKGAGEVCAFLRQLGFVVREVRLGEFVKAGVTVRRLARPLAVRA